METSVKGQMNTSKLYNLVSQMAGISLIFTAFFLCAKVSSLYESWSAQIKNAVLIGSIVFGIASILLVAFCIFIYVKEKMYGGKLDIIISCGLIIVVQYLLRVGMVGSIQMEEGLSSYYYIRNLAMSPDIILTNFIEAGRMTGRISHGYTFFALMGEFLVPGTGYGFQWVHLFLAIAASICIYRIIKALFPRVNTVVVWLAAFTVSVQPMFLGFSTLCSIEFGIVAFFIFAFYCYLYKKYIFMTFWLILLASCKSIGLIIALCFVFAVFVSRFIAQVLKLEDTVGVASEAQETELEDEESQISYKNIFIMIAIGATFALLAFVIGKVCQINGVMIDWTHVKLKLAQLYVLNFGWIWAMVTGIGVFMVYANKRVKKTNKISFKPLFVLVFCYLIHTAYLIFYPKSALPRYDMLSDVLLVLFGIFVLFKMFERIRAIVPVIAIFAVCMVLESFVTIDPVSADLFTNVKTNSFPLLDTSSFRKDVKEVYDNPGDYSFYNYQYTFVDRAVNTILEDFGWTEDCMILTAYVGNELQFRYDDLYWDTQKKIRAYITEDNSEGRYQHIGRINAFSYVKLEPKAERVVVIDSPETNANTAQALSGLSQFYEVSERFVADEGFAGSVGYYFLTLKK